MFLPSVCLYDVVCSLSYTFPPGIFVEDDPRKKWNEGCKRDYKDKERQMMIIIIKYLRDARYNKN